MSIFHYYGILPSYNKKSLKKSKASKDRDIHPAICLIGTFNLSKEAQVGPWEGYGAGKVESGAPPVEIDPWEEELHLDKYFFKSCANYDYQHYISWEHPCPLPWPKHLIIIALLSFKITQRGRCCSYRYFPYEPAMVPLVVMVVLGVQPSLSAYKVSGFMTLRQLARQAFCFCILTSALPS